MEKNSRRSSNYGNYSKMATSRDDQTFKQTGSSLDASFVMSRNKDSSTLTKESNVSKMQHSINDLGDSNGETLANQSVASKAILSGNY